MLIAYDFDGCSAAPLTQYQNNEIYQEITKEAGKLKAATTKKLRLKVIAYSQAEYFYTTSSQGQTMTFKSYNVTKENNIAA